MLENAQRVQGVPRATRPGLGNVSIAPPPQEGAQVPPESLFGMESTRPMEPETEGLPVGPGGGPPPDQMDDQRVAFLQYFVDNYRNQDALDLLNEITAQRAEVQSVAEVPDVAAPVAEEDMDPADFEEDEEFYDQDEDFDTAPDEDDLDEIALADQQGQVPETEGEPVPETEPVVEEVVPSPPP